MVRISVNMVGERETVGKCPGDRRFERDYLGLLQYTKVLNDLLHGRKIKEAQRGLLVSGVLIALRDEAFRNGFTAEKEGYAATGENLLCPVYNGQQT